MSKPIKTGAPILKLHIPLSIQPARIFQQFEQVATKQYFQVIEAEENVATAVSRDQFSLKQLFSRCFPMNKPSDDDELGVGSGGSAVCAIKLQISVNDVKGCRRVIVKGLSGENSKINQFTGQFRAAVHDLVRLSQSQNSSAPLQSKQLARK